MKPDTLKQKAGKEGGEAKKALLVVASTKNGARINIAENDSDSQKEQQSDTFLIELDHKLASRTISPELKLTELLKTKIEGLSNYRHSCIIIISLKNILSTIIIIIIQQRC
jgi:hypothetical protein